MYAAAIHHHFVGRLRPSLQLLRREQKSASPAQIRHLSLSFRESMAYCCRSFCDPGVVGFAGESNQNAVFPVRSGRSGVCFRSRNAAVYLSVIRSCAVNKRSVGIKCSAQPNHVGKAVESNFAVKGGGDVSGVTDGSVAAVELDSSAGGGGGDAFLGNNDGGRFPPGGGGGGDGGDGNDDDDYEEKEFGPLLVFEEVMREVQARGVTLPSDMLEAAKSIGIRKVLLLRYLDLQASAWPLGPAIRICSMLRNRMLADPAFLFKIGTEIVIDSCCATFAEVQKRGKDFWSEFELYAADLLVGLVVNVALVGMLAPYARFGQASVSSGFFGRVQHAYNALPSSVFEAERPGCRFSVQQRVATYFYKGIMYASVGFFCGIIGQGIANLIMTAKRNIKKSEDDIPVPPLLKSAVLWGVFLGVSSNTRYQVVNGLERVVEASSLAKQVPPVALAFTVGVRFANNIYGGMQFVDWARWSGVQ